MNVSSNKIFNIVPPENQMNLLWINKQNHFSMEVQVTYSTDAIKVKPFISKVAQSAGTVEYTDCIPAEG